MAYPRRARGAILPSMAIRPLEMTQRVQGFDCGYGGPLKVMPLLNWMQEAAGEHARIIGVGKDTMFAAGRTWMLSRLDLRMDRAPETGEELRIMTWPSGLDRLFAQRCFLLSDGRGRRVGGALYSYLVVDFASRRPLRPERVIPPDLRADEPMPYPDLSAGAGEASPATVAAMEEAFSIKASARHIDHNGHVNSAHLADWMCDAVPGDRRGNGGLLRLKVDYLNELLEGETASSLWIPLDDGGNFSMLRRGADTVARARSWWG